jgi:monoamine oxidase
MEPRPPAWQAASLDAQPSTTPDQNRFTRLSYSYQTVESAKMDAPTLLAEPAMNGRLLFAGEATHHDYFQSVHGAIESGRREAKKILDNLK